MALGRIVTAVVALAVALPCFALPGSRPPPAPTPAGGGGRPPSGTRPPPAGGGAAATPAAADVGPAPVAVASTGSFAPVWLGPLPTRPPEAMRSAAADALPDAGLSGVDDGEFLRVAQTGNVNRRQRYADGRVVSAGQVQASRDWVGKVTAAGTVNGVAWLAMRLERKPDRPIDVEVAAPAGAVDEFDSLPDPDFAAASLWMLQKAGIDKAELCDHQSGVDPAIADHVRAQCDVKWLGKPGSLTDPDLIFPSTAKLLGFLAADAGLAFGGGRNLVPGFAGGQVVWSSRQAGFMATSRLELAYVPLRGTRYAIDWMVGLQAGVAKTGIALQVGAGLSGVSAKDQTQLGFGLELPARLQFHTEFGARSFLLWFEPSWVIGGGRSKGSPTFAWADQFRGGFWSGSATTGLGVRGFGAELWETQDARIVTVMLGIFTFL